MALRATLRVLYRYLAVPLHLLQGSYALVYFLWLRYIGHHRIGSRQRPTTGIPRIVMLVVTALNQDPRVEREARALAAQGFAVKIICPAWWDARQGNRFTLNWGAGITFQILPRWTARFAYYFPYVFSFSMLRAALREPARAYHAHDLTTAFMALIAAARRRAICVCDFHEWYAENVTYHEKSQSFRPHPALKRKLFQAFERLTLQAATEVITVCDSIAEALQERYHAAKPVHVIRNIPFISSAHDTPAYEDLRQTLGLTDELIVLYQGGLGPSRNLEPVIGAMPHVQGAVLVIRGPGHEVYGPVYKALAQRLGVDHKVYCLAPVPSARVVDEARAGNLGLWTLLANVGLNFHYALGNKIFEYLAAGLPLLAADLPEARRLVEQYQVGACFDPDSSTSIAVTINRMVTDHGFRETCRANIPHALQAMRADLEWDKLVGLYLRLMEPR